MAAVTPNSVETIGNPKLIVPSLDSSSAQAGMVQQGLTHRVFHFASIDDGDTWVSGIERVVYAHCHSFGTPYAKVTAIDAATGTITFSVNTSGAEGWLHVWSGK